MNESNPVLQEYIEWLATPPEDREPKTQKELAKKLGVKEPQLSIWKKELNLYSAKPSEIKALFDHIIGEAKKGGNAQMARLAWDITHPKDEAIKTEGLSADDFINIAIKTIERLRNEYREGGGSCSVCGRPKVFPEEVRLHSDEDKPAQDNQMGAVELSA